MIVSEDLPWSSGSQGRIVQRSCLLRNQPLSLGVRADCMSVVSEQASATTGNHWRLPKPGPVLMVAASMEIKMSKVQDVVANVPSLPHKIIDQRRAQLDRLIPPVA